MARKSKRNYFGLDTEDAIIKYNGMEPSYEKDKVYEYDIHPALDKLVENVIHKYKFYHYESNYDDLKHETIVYIHERLNKFSREKGKAFSYFTIVARNFLIVKNTENYESLKNRDPLITLDDRRNLSNELHSEERNTLLSDFVTEWSTWGIDNIDILFDSDRDKKIAEAVFVIFKNCNDIDNYNKKALYILIREHAGVKTQYITKIINKLKALFKEMSIEYFKEGTIIWDSYIETMRTY